MKCKKCGTNFESNFCPNCGEKRTPEKNEYNIDFSETSQGVQSQIKKTNKLLGFRSNTKYKKIISITYLIFTCMFMIDTFSKTNSVRDIITAISYLFWMISPYVFLSNFKYRDFLPLFKDRKYSSSFLGMIFVIFISSFIFTTISSAIPCKHEWIEKEQCLATCTEQGYIKKHCNLCNTDDIKIIEKTEHQFNVIEDTNEKTVKKCSKCETTTTEEKQKETESILTITPQTTPIDSKDTSIITFTEPLETKHEHNWQPATCESPSICLTCEEIKEDALGHTTDIGICSRCEKEFRKTSPVSITEQKYNIDYLGGVEWNFKIRNNTDKQIKYVIMEWNCYNAVGDLIFDEISRESFVRIRFTGPLDAYSTSQSIRNTTKFYNYNYKSSTMTEIIVEYMDGSTEEVTKYHDDIFD